MKMEEIKLEKVRYTEGVKYSVIEWKLKTLYENQEKLLEAIKILHNDLGKIQGSIS